MSGVRKEPYARGRADRLRRGVSFAVTFAMLFELVPAQGLRGIARASEGGEGVVRALEGDDIAVSSAEAGQPIAPAGGDELGTALPLVAQDDAAVSVANLDELRVALAGSASRINLTADLIANTANTVELNLQGKTIDLGGRRILVSNGTKMLLSNGTIATSIEMSDSSLQASGSGTVLTLGDGLVVSGRCALLYASDQATVNISGAALEARGSTKLAAASCHYATVNMSAGSISSDSQAAVVVSGAQRGSTGTFSVTGGEVHGTSGGEAQASSYSAVIARNYGVVTLSGEGRVVSEHASALEATAEGTVEVRGGTVITNASGLPAVLAHQNVGASAVVTAGTIEAPQGTGVSATGNGRASVSGTATIRAAKAMGIPSDGAGSSLTVDASALTLATDDAVHADAGSVKAVGGSPKVRVAGGAVALEGAFGTLTYDGGSVSGSDYQASTINVGTPDNITAEVGSITAAVRAHDVQVYGKVNGKLTATGAVVVHGSGVVSGGIDPTTVTLEEGATVTGDIVTQEGGKVVVGGDVTVTGKVSATTVELTGDTTFTVNPGSSVGVLAVAKGVSATILGDTISTLAVAGGASATIKGGRINRVELGDGARLTVDAGTIDTIGAATGATLTSQTTLELNGGIYGENPATATALSATTRIYPNGTYPVKNGSVYVIDATDTTHHASMSMQRSTFQYRATGYGLAELSQYVTVTIDSQVVPSTSYRLALKDVPSSSGDGGQWITAAGTYELQAIFTDADHRGLVVSHEVTISPSPVMVNFESIRSQVFTGHAITPDVSVYDVEGASLISGVHESGTTSDGSRFTLTYRDNTYVGTASVAFEMDKDNRRYSATDGRFAITQASMASVVAQGLPTKVVRPASSGTVTPYKLAFGKEAGALASDEILVTPMLGDYALRLGEDYTVTPTKAPTSLAAGSYTYTLEATAPSASDSAKGNLTGSLVLTYEIADEQATATVGDTVTRHASVADALAATRDAEGQVTIRLTGTQKAVTEDVSIPAGMDVRLNLNGHDVTGKITLGNQSKLLVTDLSAGDDASRAGSVTQAIACGAGTLTIEGGKHDVVPAGSATITGGWFSESFAAYALGSESVYVAGESDDAQHPLMVREAGVGGARIGNIYYMTVATAVAGASDGDTIVVAFGHSFDTPVTVDKDLTIDLNGKTLTYRGFSTTAGNANADRYALEIAEGRTLSVVGSADGMQRGTMGVGRTGGTANRTRGFFKVGLNAKLSISNATLKADTFGYTYNNSLLSGLIYLADNTENNPRVTTEVTLTNVDADTNYAVFNSNPAYWAFATLSVTGGTYKRSDAHSDKANERPFNLIGTDATFDGVTITSGWGPCVEVIGLGTADATRFGVRATKATFKNNAFTVTAAENDPIHSAISISKDGIADILNGSYKGTYGLINTSSGGHATITDGEFVGTTAAVRSDINDEAVTAGHSSELDITGGRFQGGILATIRSGNRVSVAGNEATGTAPVFTVRVPDDCCASGWVSSATALADYPYTVAHGTMVALITRGGKSYYFASVSAALAAAAMRGETVTLLSDHREDVVANALQGPALQPQAEQGATLDLAGHRLANIASDTLTVRDGATLAVRDSSEGRTGALDNVTNGKAAIMNEGDLTLADVTLTRSGEAAPTESDTTGNTAPTIVNRGVLELGDGVILRSAGTRSPLVENGWQVPTDNLERTLAQLSVRGGILEGGSYNVANLSYGSLTIEGGSLTGIDGSKGNVLVEHQARIASGAFVNLTGANVIMGAKGTGAAAAYQNADLVITNGTFSAKAGTPNVAALDDTLAAGQQAATVAIRNEGTIAENGGTFSNGFANADLPESVTLSCYPANYALELVRYGTSDYQLAPSLRAFDFVLADRTYSGVAQVPTALDIKVYLTGTTTEAGNLIAADDYVIGSSYVPQFDGVTLPATVEGRPLDAGAYTTTVTPAATSATYRGSRSAVASLTVRPYDISKEGGSSMDGVTLSDAIAAVTFDPGKLGVIGAQGNVPSLIAGTKVLELTNGEVVRAVPAIEPAIVTNDAAETPPTPVAPPTTESISGVVVSTAADAYKNNGAAGTATVAVSGQGNFTGSRDVTYQVSPFPLTSDNVRIDSASLTTDGIDVGISLVYGEGKVRPLTPTIDYQLTISSRHNLVGTARVEGMGNYTGVASKTFDIASISIENEADIYLSPAAPTIVTGSTRAGIEAALATAQATRVWKSELVDGVRVGSKDATYSEVYDGTAHQPALTIVVNPQADVPTAYVYDPNDPVASATFERYFSARPVATTDAATGVPYVLLAKGEGFVGTPPITFDVTPYVLTLGTGMTPASFTVDGVSNTTYTGSQVTFNDAVVRTVGTPARQLVRGIDYELGYGTNVNAGIGSMTVLGKGNYAGGGELSFSIGRAPIDLPVAHERSYTGEEQVGVEEGAGYTLEGETKATEVGDYLVIATPDANHQWADSTLSDPTAPAVLEWSITQADASGLVTAIGEARADIAGTAVSFGGAELASDRTFATPLAVASLEKVLDGAQALLDGGTALPAQLKEAVKTVVDAQAAFDASKRYGRRSPQLRLRGHVEDIGWQGWETAGSSVVRLGTTGLSKRMEAIDFQLTDAAGYDGESGISVRTHLQTFGWRNAKESGLNDGAATMVGTTGQARRLEALEIELTGELAEHYDVIYRAHVQTFGWQDWVRNGEQAGTTGLSKRVEALEICFVPKS